MRKLRLATVVLAVVVALAIAPAAVATTVEPFEGTQCGFIESITEQGGQGPLVVDQVHLRAIFDLLVQGSIIFERMYDPDTMRGTVSGTISGSGPNTHSGELHGRITEEGMSGTFMMIRRIDGNEPTYRIVGQWESIGHPQPPSGATEFTYCVSFSGHIIGPFN